MAFYLQTDGVDDVLYYSGASFSIDEIILDCEATSARAAFDKYQGSSSGRFLQRNGSSQDSWSGWSAVEINGVSQTNNTSFIPTSARVTIRITGTSVSNTQVYIFANNTAGSGSMPGKIYGVTFKNAGVTVLNWDLTLGNANDQSGNGRNGTVVGATFISDGAGGTAYTKSLSDSVSTSETFAKLMGKSANDSITTSDSLFKSFSVAIVDTVSMSDDSSKQQGKAVNLSDSVLITDAISKALSKLKTDSMSISDTDSESVIKAFADSLNASDSITTLSGKAIVLSDSVTLTDALSKSSVKLAVDSVAVSDALTKTANVSLRLYDVVVTTDSIQTNLPNAPTIIGTISLRGERNIYVYLTGSRVLNAALRGDLMTVKNQNFEMYAGDTKNIEITISSVNLAGASVKWAAKKTIYDAVPALYKDTAGGITITDAAAGKFTIALAPADTADLSGKYYHEAEVTDQSGNVSTVTTGTITINLSGV